MTDGRTTLSLESLLWLKIWLKTLKNLEKYHNFVQNYEDYIEGICNFFWQQHGKINSDNIIGFILNLCVNWFWVHKGSQLLDFAAHM